ncbi:MAG: glycerophosphodiester phosphodiesterase [Candidatus Omnitrophica bacterium]|nr:glycerophosphodiester phosphodiesterase [Candidatus Omnitrophota bacterium]
MQRVGHRGDPRHAPENTLASLAMAWRHGRRAVECDVRATRDGVPILFHDAVLDRMTPARGPVSARPWTTVRSLGVTSVAEVLAVFRRRAMTIYFDVKVTGLERALHRAIVRARMADRCRIASSHPAVLTRFARLAPRLPLYRVTGYHRPITPRIVRGARRLGLRGVLVFTRWATASAVARCRAAGLELYVWTVRRAADEARFQRLGVTGIMTERCPH